VHAIVFLKVLPTTIRAIAGARIHRWESDSEAQVGRRRRVAVAEDFGGEAGRGAGGGDATASLTMALLS
jgi:hypothetical protein